MLPKRSADFFHFKKRCLERYNLEITPEEYEKAIQIIKIPYCIGVESESKYLGKLTKSRRIYDVSIRGVIVRVIYSNSQKSLVTALPKGATFIRLTP